MRLLGNLILLLAGLIVLEASSELRSTDTQLPVVTHWFSDFIALLMLLTHLLQLKSSCRATTRTCLIGHPFVPELISSRNAHHPVALGTSHGKHKSPFSLRSQSGMKQTPRPRVLLVTEVWSCLECELYEVCWENFARFVIDFG